MRGHSLRVRLLLMFMLVTILAVGAVTLLINQATIGAFQQYIRHQQESDQHLITQILMVYRQDPQNGQALVEQMAQTDKIRLLVVDHTAHVVADSNLCFSGLSTVLIGVLNVGLSNVLSDMLIIGPTYRLSEMLNSILIAGLSYWVLLGLYRGVMQEHLSDQDRHQFNPGNLHVFLGLFHFSFLR